MPQQGRPVTEVVVTVLLALVVGFQVLLVVLTVGSAVGGADSDPHGYQLIFGVAMVVVTLPITLLLLMVRGWLRGRRRAAAAPGPTDSGADRPRP